jgi:hypothetical protein
MLEYCDPPAGIFEWRESTESWQDSHSVEELEAKRALALAFSAASAKASSIGIEQRFNDLAAAWAHETAHLSSPAQIMMHPSYQAILGMAGSDKTQVVRLMINDLKQNRRPWFWALSYLTNANPVKPSEAGKMDKMIKSWVEWGKQHGLI